jgi:hypothetical protein
VIVVLAHHMKPLVIPPLLEGPLLLVLTFTLCCAGYEAIRRTRRLHPLFGLKSAGDSGRQAHGAAEISL